MKIYTLSVVDSDGSIGKNGAILTPSREIILNESAGSEDDLRLGEGILVENAKRLPKDWDHSPYFLDGKQYRQSVCATTPSNCVKREHAIFIWERVA